jgi:hypothetical protein
MGSVNADTAAKAGDFLFRYMRARHRFLESTEHPPPAGHLAALIARGKQGFDEIYIEPEANPPVALDGKAYDLFEAIIRKHYSAMPGWDWLLLAAWRNYVFSDGPLPRKPGPRRAANVASVQLPATPAMVDSAPDSLDIKNARCAWMNTRGRNSNTTPRNGNNQRSYAKLSAALPSGPPTAV